MPGSGMASRHRGRNGGFFVAEAGARFSRAPQDPVRTAPAFAMLPLKPHAGAADIDFVAGAQFLAAPIAGRNFNRPAIAEDASTEFAGIVADAKLACSQMNVGMFA